MPGEAAAVVSELALLKALGPEHNKYKQRTPSEKDIGLLRKPENERTPKT